MIPIILPSRVSYGVSIVSSLEKPGRVITAPALYLAISIEEMKPADRSANDPEFTTSMSILSRQEKISYISKLDLSHMILSKNGDIVLRY